MPGFAHRSALIALTLAATAPSSALAVETTLDPTAPRRIVVGEPGAAASMPRLDGARTNRSKVPLPLDPVVGARVRLPSDISTPPAIDDRGRLVVATADGSLSQLDAVGRMQWTATLGSEADLGPVIASDGTRFVVTERGDVLGFDASGERTFRVRLDAARGALRAAPLCASDGSVVVAVGTRATRFGSGGAMLSTATTDDPIVALVEHGRTTFIVTDGGDVLAWRPPALPRELSSFGGRPTSDVVSNGESSLLAVLRESALVALDVRDGRRKTIATTAPDTVAGAPAVLRSGEIRFVTRAGWLVGHDGERETVRLSVSPTAAFSPGPASAPSLPLLADSTGAVAFVNGASVVGVASPANEVRTVAVEGCGTPLSLLPQAPNAMVLVCRSGLVALIAGRPATQAPERPQ